MKLTSLLHVGNICPGIAAATKKDALRQMLERTVETQGLTPAGGGRITLDQLLEALLEREGKSATLVAPGIGYPHARCEGFGDFIVALGTAPGGVDYGVRSAVPVRLLLMAIAPPEKNALLLGVMACLSHIIARPELVERIVECPDAGEIWQMLHEADLEVEENVTASDLMKRQFVSVSPDATLVEAARLMHLEHLDAVAVLGPDGELMGEITARGLFNACMPPYFSTLPSLDFATTFNAFEHFFHRRANEKVSRHLNTSPPAIDADTPLAAIIARLARPEVEKLYVVEDMKLLGTIDSFSIIDKVLSL